MFYNVHTILVQLYLINKYTYIGDACSKYFLLHNRKSLDTTGLIFHQKILGQGGPKILLLIYLQPWTSSLHEVETHVLVWVLSCCCGYTLLLVKCPPLRYYLLFRCMWKFTNDVKTGHHFLLTSVVLWGFPTLWCGHRWELMVGCSAFSLIKKPSASKHKIWGSCDGMSSVHILQQML